MKQKCKVIGICMLLILLLTACGNTWEKHYELGAKYLSEGNYEEAIIEFTAAIELDESKAEAFEQRANVYILLAEMDKDERVAFTEMSKSKLEQSAEADLLQAIELGTETVETYTWLDEFYQEQGEYDKSLEILKKGYECTKDVKLQKLLQEHEAECIRETYKEYFLENFSTTDKVVLADLTHDSKDEMLVIEVSAPNGWNDSYRSYQTKVFQYSENGNVEKLTDLYGGNSDHAGGFFNAYIKISSKGYANLGHEIFTMWQGMGTLSFEEFYLDEDGNTVSVDSVNVDSGEKKNQNEEGFVSEKAMSNYRKELNKILTGFKCIVCCYTEASTDLTEIESRPEKVFAEN